MRDSKTKSMSFFRRITVAVAFSFSAIGFVVGCGTGKPKTDDKAKNSAPVKSNDKTGTEDGSGTQ